MNKKSYLSHAYLPVNVLHTHVMAPGGRLAHLGFTPRSYSPASARKAPKVTVRVQAAALTQESSHAA